MTHITPQLTNDLIPAASVPSAPRISSPAAARVASAAAATTTIVIAAASVASTWNCNK